MLQHLRNTIMNTTCLLSGDHIEWFLGHAKPAVFITEQTLITCLHDIGSFPLAYVHADCWLSTTRNFSIVIRTLFSLWEVGVWAPDYRAWRLEYFKDVMIYRYIDMSWHKWFDMMSWQPSHSNMSWQTWILFENSAADRSCLPETLPLSDRHEPKKLQFQMKHNFYQRNVVDKEPRY